MEWLSISNTQRQQKHKAKLFEARLNHAYVTAGINAAQELIDLWGTKVNIADEATGWTMLHWAIHLGHPNVINLLLDCSQTDVNATNTHGNTPLHFACEKNQNKTIERLLLNPRIDIYACNKYGETPLYVAFSIYTSCRESTEAMITLLTYICRKDNDLFNTLSTLMQDGNWDNPNCWVSFNLAFYAHKAFEKFSFCKITGIDNGRQSLASLGKEHLLEIYFQLLPADYFALVVFLCDDLFSIKIVDITTATRFFNIVQQLPIDLQMIVCCRLANSMKNNIPNKNNEMAFKNLAKKLLAELALRDQPAPPPDNSPEDYYSLYS